MTERQHSDEQAPRGTVSPGGRRQDDLTLRDIWRMVRRTRWIGAFVLLIGSGGGWLGGQVLSPLATRVETNERRLSVVESQVDELKDAVRLGNYMSCTLMRRLDPSAVPAECNQVILNWRRGIR
jgi:hypothetical protein